MSGIIITIALAFLSLGQRVASQSEDCTNALIAQATACTGIAPGDGYCTGDCRDAINVVIDTCDGSDTEAS